LFYIPNLSYYVISYPFNDYNFGKHVSISYTYYPSLRFINKCFKLGIVFNDLRILFNNLKLLFVILINYNCFNEDKFGGKLFNLLFYKLRFFKLINLGKLLI